ncbi:DUF3772 domain-containing protein [Celeribacter sp.]|uniref:DUF3772 domain-containing protein n=1 Tax=Celeribacter sp. TaxID=1890673 RepID=UPI003A91C269
MRHAITRLILIIALCLPLSAVAQDIVAPDYDAWAQVANEAETAVESGTADDATLEALRTELSTWRGQFLSAEETNAARIATLRAQIATLGDPPAEGAEEPADVAARRKELNEQLDRALAPVRNAEEAYTRADGLIGEIDDVLVSRQTDALMELGPTPLNPVNWPNALTDLTTTALTAWTRVVDNAGSARGLSALKSNAATIIFFTVAGFVLILRGRAWSVRASEKVQSYVTGNAGRGVSGFVGSLGLVVLPVAGLFALSQAAQFTGLLGARGEAVFDALPLIGLFYFTARWLAGRVLVATETSEPLFDLTPQQTREASGHLSVMGVMYGVNLLLVALAEIDAYTPATFNVLSFPLVVLTALSLFRFGQILAASGRRQREAVEAEDSDVPSTQGFVALVSSTAARVIRPGASLAILLGAVGYMSAAKGLVFPAVLTLALLGALLVVSRVIADAYVVVTRRPDGAGEGLVPVMVSTVFLVLSLPIFALIWGARRDQLWEIWARMKEGVSLGEAQISITDFLTFAIVFAVGFGLTRLVKAALSSSILPKTNLDKGGQNAIVAGTGYLGIFLAAIIAITAAGIDLSALAIVAGALSVGIGFGLQNIVQNFVSGIILLIERPVSEGDWIEVGGQMGYVRSISVRSTRVETFDRTDVIVPNADLISNSVTNYTRGNLIGRVTIKVGVAYGTDTRRVEAILREIVEAQPMVLLNPGPQVLFMGFGADALDFEVRAILRDVTSIMTVTNDVNHEIAKRFGEEGIEIPFAQRDIWLRNPEALTGRTPPPAAQSSEAQESKRAPAKEKVRKVEPPIEADTAPDWSDPDGSGESDGES